MWNCLLSSIREILVHISSMAQDDFLTRIKTAQVVIDEMIGVSRALGYQPSLLLHCVGARLVVWCIAHGRQRNSTEGDESLRLLFLCCGRVCFDASRMLGGE
jgi:hypothetical protein